MLARNSEQWAVGGEQWTGNVRLGAQDRQAGSAGILPALSAAGANQSVHPINLASKTLFDEGKPRLIAGRMPALPAQRPLSTPRLLPTAHRPLLSCAAMETCRLMIVAGEASGDAHAAALVKALRAGSS